LREVKAGNSRYSCSIMNQRPEVAGTGRCSACGAEFACGVADADGCWCTRLPVLPADGVTTGAGCLCERCLLERIAAVYGSAAIADPAVQ
jgi:hypothetical protein